MADRYALRRPIIRLVTAVMDDRVPGDPTLGQIADDLLAEIEPLIHADLRARVKMLDQFPWVDGPERRLMVLIDDVLDLIGGGDD